MKILHLTILVLASTLLVPLSFVHGDMLEVQNMNVYTDKDSYGKGEVIQISGEIQSANGLTVSKDIPITIILANDVLHKTMETMKTYPSLNGNFAVAGISTTNSSWESSGIYTVIASYGNIVNTTTTFSFEMGDKNLLSPLRQSKLVPQDKIECRSDLQPITKAEDGSIVCVTQQTTHVLVERGWAASTQESSIGIIGLNAEYTIGQPIHATVNYTGWMNGGIYPDVKILNADNGSKVWSNCLYAHTESAGGGGIGTATYNVQCRDKYPIINETGTYTMIASVDNDIAKARFTIVKPLTLPVSFESCNTPYSQSNTGIAVLYMPTNSVGKICIQYYNLNNTPTSIGMRIFEANNLTQNTSDVTPWTSDYTIEGNANKTIVYFIKTGNKTGFYGVSLNCGGSPLAVGYDANYTITPSDFPWLGKIFHCGVITYDSKIVGTSGIGVKYIQYP